MSPFMVKVFTGFAPGDVPAPPLDRPHARPTATTPAARPASPVTSGCGQRLPAAGGFSGNGGTAGASVSSDMPRMMTARTRRVHGKNQIVTRRTEGDAVADEHTFALTIEASGEVTPAAHPAPAETDEAAPPNDEEEPTDG